MPAPLSLKRTSAKRQPLQQIHDLQKPSKSSDPISTHCAYMQPTSMNIEKVVIHKENIDPDTLMLHEHNIPLSNLPVTEKSMEQNLGEKQAAKKKTKHRFLTKAEKELQQKLVAARIKISKMKNKVKKQAANIKAAKKLVTNPAVLDVLENCSSTAKLLMQLQWREDRKKEKGRRFTLQEKIAALSILKQSPKGYRFLRKIFILPAQQTVIKLIQMSNLMPGINSNIFSQLKTKAESMKPQEKLCIILFDEISLKANITYQERKDKISGLVDNGQERKAEFADHAQVFMVRGLMYNYKQAVSYTFSSSATKGPELAKQIKEVVKGLQEAGLIVVASVCDQGTNNRQALKLLINETRGVYLRKGEEPKENIILINEQEVIPLYDPPHLLKGIRNNLLTKNLEYYTKEGIIKTAKWSHLQLLYNENPGYKGIKLIPKLTENHVNPEKINKMKVKFASQIFSRTVASNMGYLADKNILPTESKDTADLLIFMDNIFDSVNGSNLKNKYAKPLLGPVTPNSVHHKTWVEAIQMFEKMSFITASGKKETVPTVANWVWTLKGIQMLLKKLKDKHNISSVWLRHLNQDPLENFFSAVRSHGCRNNNPTCDQFESAFATLLINNLSSVHTQGKNCENDLCNALYSFVLNENTKATATSINIQNILDINLESVEMKKNDPRVFAPLQYVSGYFLKKAKSKFFKNCSICNTDFCSDEQIEYIKYREYAGRRWLCSPSNKLIELISNLQDIINHIVKENLEALNLKEILKTAIVTLIDLDVIQCAFHRNKIIEYLLNTVIRFMTYNYCKVINRILSGRHDVEDEEDKVQIKAKKYHKKCFKRKK
ncbi:unnamed protein product [Parnassius mnemosyne]